MVHDLVQARQEELALLAHPIAQQLLTAANPARLAYVALDGTPRNVPALFRWTGEEIVLTSWPDDPKVAALRQHSVVAVTIDTAEYPFKALLIRSTAEVTIADDLSADLLPMFSRYFGPEHGAVRTAQTPYLSDHMARIAVKPTRVSVVDFETRPPRGLAQRMARLMG